MIREDFRFMRHGRQIDDLKFKETTMIAPYKRCSGIRKHALLMLHGFSSTPAVYRRMIHQLNEFDAIIVPAMPGHASTIADFSRSTAEDWIGCSRDICASLVKKYEKVDVLGFSMGGLLACKLSNEFQLNHLYLLAPSLKLFGQIGFSRKLTDILRWLGFDSIRNVAGNLFTETEAELSYRRIPLSTIREILTMISQYQFSQPSCPTDVFLGCHDAVVDSHAVAKMLADKENCRMHWLQNSAHVLPLDGDIKEILDCIQENMKHEALLKTANPHDFTHGDIVKL